MKIDIASHLGMIQREVSVREHEGKETNVVTASRTYDTAIEDVWDAITNRERIPRWFAPISGDLRVGGRFQIEGNAGGEITQCQSAKQLAVTWENAGNVSWVRAVLTKVGTESTRLEIEHAADVDEHWDQYGPGAAGLGWDLTLVGLAEHLRGADFDPKEAEQWPASDDGRKFVAHGTEGWCQASIASGTPRAAAEAAAARTLAFYTGQEEPSSSD